MLIIIQQTFVIYCKCITLTICMDYKLNIFEIMYMKITHLKTEIKMQIELIIIHQNSQLNICKTQLKLNLV